MTVRGLWLVIALPVAACSVDWAALEPLDAASDASDQDALGDAGSDTIGPGPDADQDVSTDDASADAPQEASGACMFTFGGALATYDFTGQPGNETSASASSTASGITAGAIGRSTDLVPASGANSINSSNWSLSTLDTTLYYTLTITPPANCSMDITSVSLDTLASGTGPLDGAVATSDDGFTATSGFTPGTVTNVVLSVSDATNTIEIQIYGYNAFSTLGTMRIENTMTVSGSLQ